MMISPEGYYEEYLKGKTEKQIITVIRSLKQEIGHLKNVMEHPDYGTGIVIHPSEATKLHWTREYLERAKKAFAEAGSVYTPSKAELKAADFSDNISEISRVLFSIGGYKKYVSDLSGHTLKVIMEHWEESNTLEPINEVSEPTSKQEFLEGIRKFHMGEWRRYYSTKRFGYDVCDGTQWA